MDSGEDDNRAGAETEMAERQTKCERLLRVSKWILKLWTGSD